MDLTFYFFGGEVSTSSGGTKLYPGGSLLRQGDLTSRRVSTSSGGPHLQEGLYFFRGNLTSSRRVNTSSWGDLTSSRRVSTSSEGHHFLQEGLYFFRGTSLDPGGSLLLQEGPHSLLGVFAYREPRIT